MIWPSDYAEFEKHTQGHFSGVGIQITLEKDLTIEGTGSDMLVLSGERATGTEAQRLVEISGSAVVTLRGMTLANGGGSGNVLVEFGGAVLVRRGSRLTMIGCRLSGIPAAHTIDSRIEACQRFFQLAAIAGVSG